MSFVKLNEDHQSASSEVFLDTSVHYCFLKGPVKPRLNWLLRQFDWKGSSTYSRLEYGNNILSVAAWCLNKLNELGDVAAVIEHVNHVLNFQHVAKKTWAFTLLDTLAESKEDRTRLARASLRRLLKLGSRAIDAHCDAPLEDGTECHWGTTGLKRLGSSAFVWNKPTCVSAKKACNLDGFFRKNRDLFLRIKAAIDGLDNAQRTPQLNDFSRVIGEANEDPTILLNYKTGCKLLADAIIAVDGKDYRNIVTQNYKESQILAKVLNQNCYNLPNNPEGGVELQTAD
jgi:hypothetical protein